MLLIEHYPYPIEQKCNSISSNLNVHQSTVEIAEVRYLFIGIIHTSHFCNYLLSFPFSISSIFLLLSSYPTVTPESCFYQRCLSCDPTDALSPGSPVECQPSNWVTAQWIHQLGHPPPSTDSKVPVEYRCLKMVATPDNKSCELRSPRNLTCKVTDKDQLYNIK